MLGAKVQVGKSSHHGDQSPGICAPLLYVTKHLEISPAGKLQYIKSTDLFIRHIKIMLSRRPDCKLRNCIVKVQQY